MEAMMRSNIDRRHKALNGRNDVDNVELDYDDGELVLRALMPEMDDEFESWVEVDLGLDIKKVSHVVFGLEVEIK